MTYRNNLFSTKRKKKIVTGLPNEFVTSQQQVQSCITLMHTKAGRLPVHKLSELVWTLLAHLEHLEFTLEVTLPSPDRVCVFMRSAKRAPVRVRYCSTRFTGELGRRKPTKKRDCTIETSQSDDFVFSVSTTSLIYVTLMGINKQN